MDEGTIGAVKDEGVGVVVETGVPGIDPLM
jgi:hypothetical protein